MYAPKSFRENRLPVLHDFIRENAFASVVTNGSDGMRASHVPLILDAAHGTHGRLFGHVARANPQWRDLAEAAEVPAVHAYGPAWVFEDAASLRELLESLTDKHESAQNIPWKASAAPDDYIEDAMRAIVGFELSLSRVEGVWKMSQNRSSEDRAGAAIGLRQGGEHEVADLIERLGGDQ